MLAECRLEISLRRCEKGQEYVIGADKSHAHRTLHTEEKLSLVAPAKKQESKAALSEHYGAIQKIVAAGHSRHNSRSPDWVGIRVASHLGLSLDDEAHRTTIISILRGMEESGFLMRVKITDANSRRRPHYAVGTKFMDEPGLE